MCCINGRKRLINWIIWLPKTRRIKLIIIIIVNKTVSCNLLPGESKLFEDKFSFDNITRIENFTVETVADGQKDTSQSQLKEEVSYTDLGITDVKKTITKDGVQYTATVTNKGQVAASGIIDFYKDGLDHEQISELLQILISLGG